MTEKPTRVNQTSCCRCWRSLGSPNAVLSAIVIPALPTLQHDLHTSETGVTWVLTAYLIAASIGTSILGRLGDMYGKERVLVWTMVVLTVGTLLAAVAQSLAMLVVARAMQGAAGGIYPLAFGMCATSSRASASPGASGCSRRSSASAAARASSPPA